MSQAPGVDEAKAAELLAKLSAPFPPEAVEWRVQRAGQGRNGVWAAVAPYVDARAIMDRLDASVGPANWQNQLQPLPGGAGFLSGLGILFEGEWVWRWDGAACTDVEGIKGGISSALKRSAVLWGVGRYLYRLDAAYAEVLDGKAPGAFFARSKQKNGPDLEFWWRPPELPAWALPAKEPKPQAPDPPPAASWWALPPWAAELRKRGGPLAAFADQVERVAGRWPNAWSATLPETPWTTAGECLKRQGVAGVQALAELRSPAAPLNKALADFAEQVSRRVGARVEVPRLEDG